MTLRRTGLLLAALLCACEASPGAAVDDAAPGTDAAPGVDVATDSAAADLPRDPGPQQDACIPTCGARECGGDGCGGSCGTCPGGRSCIDGSCECLPQAKKACCGDAVCWFDSCGVQGDRVATCPEGCANAVCLKCAPQCQGRQCGDDGCGGTCGNCPAARCDGLSWTRASTCSAGKCVAVAVESCDDGEACTRDTCGATTGCAHELLAGNCFIDDACWALGDRNPADPCQACAAGMPDAWAQRKTGSTCGTGACNGLAWTAKTCNPEGQCLNTKPKDCDDAKACTTDACDPTAGCTNVVVAGQCLVGGACRPNGDPNPDNPCQWCRSNVSNREWTADPDGTWCGAGKECQGGQCVPFTCPDGYAEVTAGRYTRGSPIGEPGRQDEFEGPQHQVTLSRSFCLKATEVTQAEWIDLMGDGATPWKYRYCGAQCPLDCANWWDALAFANALSRREGLQECYTLVGCGVTVPGKDLACTSVQFAGLACKGYRLPTEGEWEYAARAGTTTSTYNGGIDPTLLDCEQPNAVLDPIAWFCGNSAATFADAMACGAFSGNPTCGPQPVGGRKANAWGLRDMLGNVWEWVWDGFGLYGSQPVTDPLGASNEARRVIRGGGFSGQSIGCRAAARVPEDPAGYTNRGVGFRLARTIP